jgi:hypothetical protein
MNIELKDCPYCKRKAEFVIGKEMSDTCMIHKIRCSYLSCLTIERSFSGWQPDYKEQVQKMKNDWNVIVDALNNK